MPPEGFANPVASNGTGFCSNTPVSELIKRVTRAVEASIVSSAPLIMETEDGVMHETRPTAIRPQGALGSSHPILDQETKVRRLAHEGSETASHQTRARGENIDEP